MRIPVALRPRFNEWGIVSWQRAWCGGCYDSQKKTPKCILTLRVNIPLWGFEKEFRELTKYHKDRSKGDHLAWCEGTSDPFCRKPEYHR